MEGQHQTKIIGIDAGSETTGIVVLVGFKENAAVKHIRQGYNLLNSEVVDFIQEEAKGCDLTVVIEDVRPYNMRITDGIIKTIKFLGQIEWRLSQLDQKFTLLPRWEVKQWVFLQYKSIAWPEIEKKIIRAGKRKQKECEAANKPYIKRNSTPTFVYVDDRIVTKAMRKHWDIQKQLKPGQRTPYGLKDHSWQALGLVSYYLALNQAPVKKIKANKLSNELILVPE